MTPDERIDANLDRILKASGSALRNYTAATLEKMRHEMRTIERAAYISGSDACHAAYYSSTRRTK